MRPRHIGLALVALLLGCGDGPTAPNGVGVRTLSYEDPSRDREIPVDVWYPATAGAGDREIAFSGVFLARATPDAAIAADSPRPLVMLSHGSGGGRGDLGWLAERLVRAGFLVASVEHPGNRFGDDNTEGVVSVWRRPRDVSFILDRLLGDPQWSRRIDQARIGAAGFSSGGYTVIALAGGRYDPVRLGAYCSGPDAGPECSLAGDVDFASIPDLADAGLSYRDPRISAVFAMAPAVGPGVSAESLADVAIPVQVVGSIDDELTLFPTNAAHYASAIPGAGLTAVQPGGHFVYMSPCNALGRDVAALVCIDPDPATDRRAVHERVAREAVEFFGATLAR